MDQGRAPSPLRAAIFFSLCLVLLNVVGAVFQAAFGLAGAALTQVIIFVGLAFFLVSTADMRPLGEVLRLRRLSLNGVLKSIFLGLLAWGLAHMLGSLIISLVHLMGGRMEERYQALLQAPFWLALLVGGLVPAMCEEIAFRGYLQWNLGRLGDRQAIILTGLLFGIMHLSLIRVIPLAILGMVFAAGVQRTGSIMPGMIMHFVNNATVLTLSFALRSVLSAGTDTTSTAPSAGQVFFLAAASAGLGVAVYAMTRSFSPADLAEPEETSPDAEEPAGQARPVHPVRPLLVVVSLLPAVALYAYAATIEITRTFAAR